MSPPPPPRPPLGLPPGSVRALLTLMVVGYLVAQTVRGEPVGLLWTETLMFVLAHYFTSRRMVPLSPELMRKFEAEGELERDTNPLWLPRHTIRAGIVLAFGWLAWMLYQQNRLGEDQSIAVLGVVGAYFLGLLGGSVLRWVARVRNRPTPQWWVDGKALVTLLAVAGLVAVRYAKLDPPFPVAIESLEGGVLALLLFYFGSK